MKNDGFNLKSVKEFGKFIQDKVKYNKEPDIYSEMIKQLILKSYCEN